MTIDILRVIEQLELRIEDFSIKKEEREMNSIDEIMEYLKWLDYLNKCKTSDSLSKLSEALKQAPKMLEHAMDAKQYMEEILDYNAQEAKKTA